jgi:sigma-54 specific flagellar transcriptional regulator A
MKIRSLVIDANQGRANELQALLQFMEDWEVVAVGADDWAKQLEDIRGLQAVFLGAGETDEKLAETIRVIRKADANLPLVLIDEPDRSKKRLGVVMDDCCAHLARPFRHTQLTQALEDIRNWRQHRKSSQPRRQLELSRCLSGTSPAITRVCELIQSVSHSDATVLILGASGTGKEVVARNLRYFSPRREGPFVPVNCGAIPENLLESELFGHEKGSFTGAITARQGRFELAQGGTLFLDEIGDMPLPMQVKLLRVLQERVFERIGGNKSIVADVRIIAATNQNLEQLIEAGKFREDLYYRLNVFPIEVPPLRERIEDLPALVDDLRARLRQEHGGELSLSQEAMHCLSQYAWPGNIRELANLIERLAILFPNRKVEPKDLPAKFRTGYVEQLNNPPAITPNPPAPSNAAINLSEEGLDLKQYLMDLECQLINAALDKANGVVAQAAPLLRMRRTTLVEKMRKYKLKWNDEK